MSYATGLIGVWILSDSCYSLLLYHDKGESFWKCHTVRILRGILGIALILIGALGK